MRKNTIKALIQAPWFTIMILMVIAAAVVQGCSTTTEIPAPTASPLHHQSPLETQEKALEPVPSPKSGKAVIAGTLIDAQTGQGPIEGLLFLGLVETMDNEKPVISLDRNSAPSATPHNINGQFIFQDIEPGKYGLIFYTPETSLLVDDPNGEGSLMFTLEADQTLDLGTIKIPLP